MSARIKAYGLLAALAAVSVLLALQTWRLHTEQLAHRDLIASTAKADNARTTAALKVEQHTATLESTHAAATQEVSDEFTTSQPVRDAIARADLARLDRLRTDAERRAASYRAQAAAGAAACLSLADKHAALDQHIVEGVSVVGELSEVVRRRDDEVKMLRGVIEADRALLE